MKNLVLNLLKKIPKRALTLMEIITVMIIVGIVAAIGLLNYSNVKEHAMGKEAQANLRLIAAAQRIYRMESGIYYPQGGVNPTIAQINDNLRLTLPTTNDWNYTFDNMGASTFRANAQRGGCTYHIWHNTGDVQTLPNNGGCP